MYQDKNMKILTLDELQHGRLQVNDRTNMVAKMKNGGKFQFVSSTVSRVSVDAKGEESVGFLYSTTYVESTSKPGTYHTIGYIIIPCEFLPEGHPLRNEKKDVIILLDSCTGYNFQTYAKDTADKHIDFLIDQLPDLMSNKVQVYTTTYDENGKEIVYKDRRKYKIGEDSIFVLLNPLVLSRQEETQQGQQSQGANQQDKSKLLGPIGVTDFDKEPNDNVDSFAVSLDDTLGEVIQAVVENSGKAWDEMKLKMEKKMEEENKGKTLEELELEALHHPDKIDPRVLEEISSVDEQEQQLLEQLAKKYNFVLTKNFVYVFNTLRAFIFDNDRLDELAKPPLDLLEAKTQEERDKILNERLLIIDGPPGVGKTFTIQKFEEVYGDRVAFSNIKADTTDPEGVKDVLIGVDFLEGEGGGTSTKINLGGLIQILSDAVNNKKEYGVVFFNEFNQSAVLSKFDEISRGIGDTSKITIRPSTNLEKVQSVLADKGIYSVINGDEIIIDLNNVDGKGQSVLLYFVLVGNLPTRELDAVDLNTQENIPAALMRRAHLASTEYFNPNDKEDLEQIRNMLYHNDHFIKPVCLYAENIAHILKMHDPERFVKDVKNCVKEGDLTPLKDRYGENIYKEMYSFAMADDENIEGSFMHSILEMYRSFYNLYENKVIRLVPAVSEIAMEMEVMLKECLKVVVPKNIQVSAVVEPILNKNLIDYFRKLETGHVAPLGFVDDQGAKDVINIMSSTLVKVASVFKSSNNLSRKKQMEMER